MAQNRTFPEFIDPNAEIPNHDDLTIVLKPLAELPSIDAIWAAAEQHFPMRFFQSWTWLAALRRQLGEDPLVAIVYHNNKIAALAWGYVQVKSSLFQKDMRSLHLHHYGTSEIDKLYPEYTGAIGFPNHLPYIYKTLMKVLLTHPTTSKDFGFTSVHFAGLPKRDAQHVAMPNMVRQSQKEDRCFGIDLKPEWGCNPALDEETQNKSEVMCIPVTDAMLTPYLQSRGKSTRAQIRRALRKYSEKGTVNICRPRGTTQALAWYESMAELHNKKWAAQGQAGAFENETFRNFHRMFLNENRGKGKVDILSLSVDDHPFGFIYNFLYKKNIYYYQSGLDYDFLSSGNPGLILHAAAICVYAYEGFHHYDFMAGESRYKSNLGMPTETLYWLNVQKKNIATCIKAHIRDVRETLTR